MTALTPQSVVSTGTTPVPITPTASDTIAVSTSGPAGWNLRVITTGTASNISVLDPGFTPQSNPGTVTPLAAPATGSRMLFIPKQAASLATGNVTVTSSSQTGLTYELYTA
jgi:hypothetical protein